MSDAHEPATPRLNLRQGLLVLGLLKWGERHQDPDRPGMVSSGPKVDAVLARAGRLAREHRQDPGAVAEIRAAAGNSKRTLERAARKSRFHGGHHELAVQNLVFRLIDAARTGKPVAEVAEDDRRRIEAVGAFSKLSEDERWELLCQREPRLVVIEHEIASGSFGRLPSRPTGLIETGETSVGPDGTQSKGFRLAGEAHQDPARTLEEMRAFSALQRRVSELAGPDSGQTDVLLRTVRAQGEAFGHLLRRAFDVAESGPIVPLS